MLLKKIKRSLLASLRRYVWFIRLFGHNKVNICKGNTIELGGAIIKDTLFYVSGTGNRILFHGKNILLDHCKIQVFGSNSSIILHSDTFLLGSSLWIEDNGSSIVIGENTKMHEQAHLAAIEGCAVKVGRDCLFSSNIYAATGDSHSVLDAADGRRINPSKDILIGDHVWIGQGVTLTKGVSIGRDSIIGGGSVVTKSFEDSNVAIAGNPAKIVKRDINWDYNRI